MKPRIALLILIATPLLALAGCTGNGGSSPSGPFTGTWSGTFGASVPMSLTVSQTGSTVVGVATVTTSAGAAGLSVNGTANGSTATVSFTYSDGSSAVPTVTLTINGSTMTTHWVGSTGTSVDGTLTAAANSSPAPNVSSSSTKYDGVYDFFFQYASPSGLANQSTARYLIIKNGVVSASDGAITGGTVDSFGAIRFTSPCPINSSVATWTGSMNAAFSAGKAGGVGKYGCSIPFGGGNSLDWQATQSK